MLFSTLLFYLFSAILLISAFIVVATRNTIHSVMFLILAFLNASGIFILVGAEFLSMLLIVVYVGAIAVLFLFVVMMLNIDRQNTENELPKKNKNNRFLALIGVVLFIEIFILIKIAFLGDSKIRSIVFPNSPEIQNVKALGNLLYTDFIYPFQVAGAILFVAMIGAIILTIRDQDHFVKRQNVASQNARSRSDSVEIVKVKSGYGVEI